MGVASTMRIGVTGHRDIADDAMEARVDAVLDELVADADVIEVWSSLAEGADRLVARRVLARPGARLVVVLPLDADDYRADFAEPASRAQFDEMLRRAERVDVAGSDESGTRTSAYERAGHAVLGGCDVLVALWDGEPSRGRGGTAEIVAEARRRGRRVVVVPVERPEPTP